MAISHLDDSVIIGTDYELQLNFTDDDGEEIVIEQSQWDADLKSCLDGDILESFTIGTVSSEDPKTTLVLTLTDTETSAFTGEKLYWDLMRTDTSGDKSLYMQGRLTLVGKISDGAI